MNKMTEWKLAQKINASGRRGIVVGLAAAALICLLVAVCIMKCRWLKHHFGCCGHSDLLDVNDGGPDDDCCYTSDKDFV